VVLDALVELGETSKENAGPDHCIRLISWSGQSRAFSARPNDRPTRAAGAEELHRAWLDRSEEVTYLGAQGSTGLQTAQAL